MFFKIIIPRARDAPGARAAERCFIFLRSESVTLLKNRARTCALPVRFCVFWFGAPWGHPGAILCHLRTILGPILGPLGTTWGHLRPARGRLGAMLGPLGAMLEPIFVRRHRGIVTSSDFGVSQVSKRNTTHERHHDKNKCRFPVLLRTCALDSARAARGHIEAMLGPSGGHFGACWGHVGASGGLLGVHFCSTSSKNRHLLRFRYLTAKQTKH